MANPKLDSLRNLTYSLDTLVPGFYLWWGQLTWQVGGTEADDDPYYPFVVPTFLGFGIVLPNYWSWHTPFEEFKRISADATSEIQDTVNSPHAA
jgi:hypothetical protein